MYLQCILIFIQWFSEINVCWTVLLVLHILHVRIKRNADVRIFLYIAKYLFSALDTSSSLNNFHSTLQ